MEVKLCLIKFRTLNLVHKPLWLSSVGVIVPGVWGRRWAGFGGRRMRCDIGWKVTAMVQKQGKQK